MVAVLLAEATPPGANASDSPSIPYVPTRHDTVRDLLWLADVSTNDVVYDLGSGDGRVVISAVRDFHAKRAVGIELDAKLVEASRSNAVAAGVADRVEFIHGDLFTNDFSAANVVVLYLGHWANLDLRPKIIRTLKPGTRVVSHQFGMGEWTWNKRLVVRSSVLGMYSEWANPFRSNPDVPDFDDSPSRREHVTLSAWVVPTPVAGVWRGKVMTDSGEKELKLTLHQRLSGVGGWFQLQGTTNIQGILEVDLWGDHLRCWCIPTNVPWRQDQIWIDGRVKGDKFSGGLRMLQRTNTIEVVWAARRDPADFTGTWEWPGASNAPVRLRLERQNGQLVATYADENREKTVWRDDTQPVPVFDIYDFGGGFYFTLLLGADRPSYRGGSRRQGPQDGWLIGEAIMEDGTLKGALTFYPYPFTRPRAGTTTPPSDRFDWQPRRVSP